MGASGAARCGRDGPALSPRGVFRRHLARPLLLLLLALAICACENARQSAEKLLAQADLVRLRRDAAVVYKDTFISSADRFVLVPPDRWPKSFQFFSPSRVKAYRNGIALVLSPEVDQEHGFYVIPEGLDVSPVPTSRARFEQLKPGVYWFDFGLLTK